MDCVPYRCVSCCAEITAETGWALVHGGPPVLCETCWDQMEVWERLDTIRGWQESAAVADAARAFAALCRDRGFDLRNLRPGEN